MQIQELTMRGFTTFKKPVHLDIAAMGPGVFAVIGDNGCLHGSVTICDPVDGSVRTVEQRCRLEKPFHVWAMGPHGPVVTAALPPVRYGPEQFVKLLFDNGVSIIVTLGHRLWTGTQWTYASEIYTKLHGRQGCVPDLLASSSVRDLSAHAEDGLRWSKTVPGSLVGCHPDPHSDGGQLLSDQGGGQVSAPLRGDALERSPCDWNRGDRPFSGEHTRLCQRDAHLAKSHSASPERHDYDGERQEPQERRQSGSVSSLVQQLPHGGSCPRCKAELPFSAFRLSTSPSDMLRRNYNFTHIVPGEEWGRKLDVVRADLLDEVEPYYDFHVPVFNNYWAHGTWHHNCGKTTLMDCMGPILYRTFPSRTPSNPADYIDKKRGAGETMIFKVGPLKLKAELKISPKGKQEAYLYAKKRKGWKPLTTGKLKDYDEQIEKLLGPLRANLASVFGQQGGGGGFESLKPADRKRLFRWYLGLDMVDEYHKEVKEQLKALDADKVKSLERDVADLKADLGRAKTRVATARADTKVAQDNAEAAQKRMDKVAVSSALTDKALRFEKLFRQGHELAAREGNLKKVLKTLGEEPELVDLDELAEMIERYDDYLGEVDEAVAECDLRVAKYDDAVGIFEDRKRRAGLADTVPCKAEGDCAECEFLLEAIEAKGELKTWAKAVKTQKRIAAEAQKHAKAMVASGAEIEEEREEAAKEYSEGTKAERKAAEQAVARVKTEEALSNVTKQLVEMMGEMDELEPELPFDDDGEIDWSEIATPKEIKAATQARDAENRALVEAITATASAEAVVFNLTKKLGEAELELRKHAKTAKELIPLRLLEEALGPNGFPIYEIDAAGPEVTGIINDLLQSSFGERFKVAIRTLSPKKTGGFKEDFDFVIRDTKADEDRVLGQMSWGEKTIVGEAVRIGFALYEAGRGTVFQMMLRDEAEGSLSPENARRYVAMLAKARDLGDFHQVFFITHSPDAAACADGAIRVKNGAVEFKASAAI